MIIIFVHVAIRTNQSAEKKKKTRIKTSIM